MSESNPATTQEMRAVRSEVAIVAESLNAFRMDVQGALKELTQAITSLVRLEERQAAQHAELARAFKWIEAHERRINQVEVSSGRADERGLANTDFRRNVERILIALLTAVGMLVVPKLFAMVS